MKIGRFALTFCHPERCGRHSAVAAGFSPPSSPRVAPRSRNLFTLSEQGSFRGLTPAKVASARLWLHKMSRDLASCADSNSHSFSTVIPSGVEGSAFSWCLASAHCSLKAVHHPHAQRASLLGGRSFSSDMSNGREALTARGSSRSGEERCSKVSPSVASHSQLATRHFLLP